MYYSICVNEGKLKITSNIISVDEGGCVLNLHFLPENQKEISMDNIKINDYRGYKKMKIIKIVEIKIKGLRAVITKPLELADGKYKVAKAKINKQQNVCQSINVANTNAAK